MHHRDAALSLTCRRSPAPSAPHAPPSPESSSSFITFSVPYLRRAHDYALPPAVVHRHSHSTSLISAPCLRPATTPYLQPSSIATVTIPTIPHPAATRSNRLGLLGKTA
ncbi:hypothetical protein Cni_G16556 [Canna indica]|uniref:Uncharacterized protein n=1 Tax=Canna indica TaxID=4628 RepID=A0AAQ3KGP8_9LILI|nr:hypothetical protein Cni_G16556 [Canna indica]